jgi:NAD(P)-dependent dehydrogenase (short-subunit alcohol dehydrogenase family)
VSTLFDVRDKVVLITGAAGGIGRMIAAGFVDAGARVYITSRDAERARDTAATLTGPGRCIGLGADVGSPVGCGILAAEFAQRENKLDVLINNAGAIARTPLPKPARAGFPETGSSADADLEIDAAAWRAVLSVNLEGVFHLIRALLPLLRAAAGDEPARVINLGSMDGIKIPVPDVYPYSASKAAVHHLTRHLAVRLAPTVTVNALAPGAFESDMTAADIARHRDWIVAHTPMARIGRSDDVAGAAIFLASRAGSYVTGAVIPVDGGALLGG